MVAFALVSSPDQRWFFTQLHCEEILVAYVILSMVFIVMKKVELASVMIGIAFSIHPGYLVFLPTFLVAIYREFGNTNLFKSFSIIVGIQIIVALPFTLFGSTSISDYIILSGSAGSNVQR